MSRSEHGEDTAFPGGSTAGPSQVAERSSQRHDPASSVDDSYRPHTTHDRYPVSYDQRSGYDQYPGGTDRARFSRGSHLDPSQERQYQRELDMMKAREAGERGYGPTASGSARVAEDEHRYGGVRAPRAAIDEFGLRSLPNERPSLDGFSRVEDGKRYRLVVVQHPSRARMCGFGDKDRRPLSPTLIVKLVITDEATGEEISPLEVNTSLFLLATDLCHPDDLMLAPRNILVHHHASSLPAHPMQHGGYQQDDYAHGADSSYGNFAEGLSDRDNRSSSGGQAAGSPEMQFGGGSFVQGQAESYTRNLVGAAVASASVLKDEQERWCIFFVFQDISVRTEGVYRIKLMFVNLEVRGSVGTGVAEALAETYTDPFTVYSPRRFPGMLDPTPLSRKLASQGIKIPVRNDKKKQRRRNDDGDTVGDGMGDYDGGSGGDEDDD